MTRARIFRKIFGWHVGETCAVQLKTKKAYGKIVELKMVHYIGGVPANKFFEAIRKGERRPRGLGRPRRDSICALVEYETKGSPIPHRQQIPIKDLLEDDRERDERES